MALALALPDQDQAEAGQRRAISCPLQLADHEARGRPFDHAGALADPEQADGQRNQADDEKHLAHRALSSVAAACWSALAVAEWRSVAAKASGCGVTQKRAALRSTDSAAFIKATKKPRTMPGLFV